LSTLIAVLTTSNVRNMGWIKAPLDTSTDSFIILTTDADGYSIDRINSNLFVTPSLITNVIEIASITWNESLINSWIEVDLNLTY